MNNYDNDKNNANSDHDDDWDIHLLCYDMDYNMVGVSVAMVISTMHEKSCIDSHNAQKF